MKTFNLFSIIGILFLNFSFWNCQTTKPISGKVSPSQTTNFEGKIIYKYSFTDMEGNDISEQMDPDISKENHYYITKGKYKILDGNGNWLSLYHSETNSYYEFEGETAGKIDAVEAPPKKFIVTKLEEHASLLGYACQAIQIEKEGTKEIIYYSPEVKVNPNNFSEHSLSNWNRELEATDGGLSLKQVIIMEASGIIMTLTATEVSKQAFKQDAFSIPENYQLIETGTQNENLEDIIVEPKGVYKEIKVKEQNEMIEILLNGSNEDIKIATAKIISNPNTYNPPVLFALAHTLFIQDHQDESAYWFLLAVGRGMIDGQLCTDKTAYGKLTILMETYGGQIFPYMLKKPKLLLNQLNKAIVFAETNDPEYDQRWISLHGMGAFSNEDKELLIPKEEWEEVKITSLSSMRQLFEEMIESGFGVNEDYLEIGKKFTFNEEEYFLKWSSNPEETYFIQEYFREQDSIEHFTKMLLVSVVIEEIGIEDLSGAKIQEIKQWKEQGLVLNYQVVKDEEKQEIIIDFLMNKGNLYEWNIYRYQQQKIKEFGIPVLFAYTYRKETKNKETLQAFFKQLETDKQLLMHQVKKFNIPKFGSE